MLYNFTQESELLLRRKRHTYRKVGGNNIKKKTYTELVPLIDHSKIIYLGPNSDGFFSGGNFKIEDLEPSRNYSSFYAQVVRSVEDGIKIRCVLGDNTGIVNAEFPETYFFIKDGIALKLENVITEVVNEHIIVVALEGVSIVTQIPDVRLKVNMALNISEAEWLEDSDSDDYLYEIEG